MIRHPLPVALAFALLASPVSGRGLGKIELVRDTWGIPHVFADTDAGALYGLGWATAEDRGFQMTYSLRIIQGRLCEVVGIVKHVRRRDTSLLVDRKMRTFGFHRAARTVAANLDRDTLALLEAYCDGVNDWFARNKDRRHFLFAKLGVEHEPWTPADCLASWWHLGQFFATDGTRDLIRWRNETGRGGRKRPEPPPGLERMPPDDAPAVVRRDDVSADWVARVAEYAKSHGMRPDAGQKPAGPKFSHAWVVGGTRTTTGSAVLVSDPQTPVRNPSLFYEFHVQGKTLNARGIGVPGSPALLIGFTDRIAWGLTALGADQADLFRLQTDRARPNQYRFDGEWREMTIRRETIEVKDGRPVPLTVRETHLGPVVTPFCFAQRGEPEVALKRIPVCEADRETIQGAFAMLRAKDAHEFAKALPGWRFPSANIVFGDREGNIGYWTLAAIPVRSGREPHRGGAAMDGTRSDCDWQGILPYDLLPHVTNPGRGAIASANHRTIGSWYPIALGLMTGAGGDTVRSWRLHERLAAAKTFKPADVLDVHYDSVNPARREIVRIGLHLRDVLGRELSPDAKQALSYLEPWLKSGASSRLTNTGAEVAVELNTFFRFMATDLAYVYGGGESGLAYFLKSVKARLDENPKARVSLLEQAFIDRALADAWRTAQRKYRGESARWPQQARELAERRPLGYFCSLDGFPSLDPANDLRFPALANVDGGTIESQAAQAYTQFVPLHDPDQAMTLLPIGASERPDTPSRASTMALWAASKLHPAPLSRKAVDTHAQSTVTLSP